VKMVAWYEGAVAAGEGHAFQPHTVAKLLHEVSLTIRCSARTAFGDDLDLVVTSSASGLMYLSSVPSCFAAGGRLPASGLRVSTATRALR